MQRRGVRFRRDGARLTLDAPAGVVSPALAEQIRRLKPELLDLWDQAHAGGSCAPVRPVPRADGCPPGLTQQRLWYLASLAPESAVYNLPAAFRLRGPLDVGSLQKALREIIRRHEVLRTRIEVRDHEPVQVIAEEVDFDLELVDLAELPPAEREPELMRRIDGVKDIPIPMTEAPMARAALYRLTPDEHVLFWMPHHVIWDGWSFDIFLGELDRLYGSFSAGEPSQFPVPTVHYADYCVAHREWTESEAFDRDLNFWEQRLSGGLPVLELPLDRPRPDFMSYEGGRVSMQLDEPLVHRLAQIGRQSNATLFMVLLAAFYALLHRYTGQDDLVVGSPVQARTISGTEELLGVFVNTLVLRTRLTDGMSFRDLLESVRDMCVSTYDYQGTPFEVLVDEFETERTLSRNPLYQVLFSYQDVTNRGNHVGDLTVEQIHIDASVSPTDLTFWLMESGSGLLGGIDYARDLFDPSTVERMADHFVTLVTAAAAEPEAAMSSLKLLADGESEALEEYGSGALVALPRRTIHELFAARVAATPDVVAVTDATAGYSYRELDRAAERIAAGLAARGVGSGDLIGVSTARSRDLPATLLAILRRGAAYVPLDPDFPAARLAFMVDDASLKVVVADAATAPSLPQSADVSVLLLEDLSTAEAAAIEHPPVDDSALAYVIYTSGSTGTPKGVQVRHRSVVNLLSGIGDTLSFSERDSLLAITTLAFDISVLELFLPILRGGCVHLASSAATKDAGRLSRLIDERQPTTLQATPATWRMLMDQGWTPKHALSALCGGEALAPDVAAWLATSCAAAHNVYGPTETTIWSSIAPITGEKRIPIGRPLANTTMYVLDRNRNRTPIGVPGDLYIGGDGVAAGYLGRPELTRERFVADPFAAGDRLMYATGDRALVGADGQFEFLGRDDLQVKIRGYRVELGEIEAALQALAEVKEAAASTFEPVPGDVRIAGYVVFMPGHELTTTELRRGLKDVLPAYMVPSAFVELDELPQTPNRKIDRQALPEPQGSLLAATRRFEPPRTREEKAVATIWERLLGVDAVSMNDNFFEIGGHSLLAMRVVAAIEDELGTPLNARELFFRSAGQLAGLIRTTAAERLPNAS